MATLEALFEKHLPHRLQLEGGTVCLRLMNCLNNTEQEKLLRLLLKPSAEKNSDLSHQFVKAVVGSRFILDNICQEPTLLFHWLLVDAPYAPLSVQRIMDIVELSTCDCTSGDELNKLLRQIRRRLMLAIIWRDINRLSDFSEVCQSMTSLAEACIQQCLNFHYAELTKKHGLPIGTLSGQPQPMLVLGMGKLGGSELNVSSDIDLIFTFPEAGETAAEKPLDNQQFFTRLGQRVIKSLNEITSEGFVFRVDMRLRPYGHSGALVSNFTALENYYETQGRDWERFASVKARIVACASLPDPEQSLILQQQYSAQLYDLLQPFVYRRYTDYSIVESLRQLKSMIEQEVRRKYSRANIKLGTGGIRELEFILQSIQLIRGGRHQQLQQRNWLAALQHMQAENIFDASTSQALHEAYIFLRNTEHAIQGWQDQQTQQLPEEPLNQAILAWVMGFTDWDNFTARLDQHRQNVSSVFQDIIAKPEYQQQQTVTVIDEHWQRLWHTLWQNKDNTNSAQWLHAQGYQQADKILAQLDKLQRSGQVKRLPENPKQQLDLLVPLILSIAAKQDRPDTGTLRILQWLEKIAGRSSYITLLLENPDVITRLIPLFRDSLWVSELLQQMPSLLDELLDDRQLYFLPQKHELQSELRQRLLRIDSDDSEAAMEVLRYFKLAHSLRVAASDLSGRLPLMKVSDYLTWIAEAVLEQVLLLVWNQLTSKHGIPSGIHKDHQHRHELEDVPGFIIVGYGKLGGIELSYNSDLDLVFIYRADPQGMTNGAKSLDNQTFYTRLGQKIIHILNTRTLSGPLYDVDMRLRPSGNSGLLASSLNAFIRYQNHDAWIWEHQALVRARPLAGDQDLARELHQLRQQILQKSRELPNLKVEIIEMRQKMRDHLGSGASSGTGTKQKSQEKAPLFHLKQDAGGIVDIEFMVQYAVLAWAHKKPGLSEHTDNIRILEALQSSDDSEFKDAALLIDIYQAYREVGHRLALQLQPSSLTEEQLQGQFANYALTVKQQQIQALWQGLLGK